MNAPMSRFGDVARYLALAPRPTEPLVAAELAALPEVTGIETLQGAVAFSGPPAACYRANLHLRCATRVLFPLSDFPCRGEADLYDQARVLPWEDFLRPTGTLAVSAHGQLPGLQNSMFTAVRVKDAVADRFRDRTGARPDVNVEDPDLRINAQLYLQDGVPRCSLSLDSSGHPLHRRGYRKTASAAPLKETLAAAILMLAGQGQAAEVPVPLVDLCCGSGTLVIEGGLMALRTAPGLLRTFGFQRWRGFDAPLWQRLRGEAEAQRRTAEAPFLFGSDVDRRMVEASTRNARAAGIGDLARFTAGDLRGQRPPEEVGERPGIVVCNPPYGERMEAADQSLSDLYRALGDTLKRNFKGYTAYVFTANLPLSKLIGLRTRERHILYNGNLEGRLLRFDLY